MHLSDKHLTYKFGNKGITSPRNCFAELSIDGSVAVDGSPIKVSLDNKLIEYSITQHDDGRTGVIMRALQLYALELQ